jgi:hypothetical protein
MPCRTPLIDFKIRFRSASFNVLHLSASTKDKTPQAYKKPDFHDGYLPRLGMNGHLSIDTTFMPSTRYSYHTL